MAQNRCRVEKAESRHTVQLARSVRAEEAGCAVGATHLLDYGPAASVASQKPAAGGLAASDTTAAGGGVRQPPGDVPDDGRTVQIDACDAGRRCILASYIRHAGPGAC